MKAKKQNPLDDLDDLEALDSPASTTSPASTASTTLTLDTPITEITVTPSNDHRTADFGFGKYSVNLDLKKACCDTYQICVNDQAFKPEENVSIPIGPSSKVVFTFGEEHYDCTATSHMQKNYLTIEFKGEGEGDGEGEGEGTKINVIRSHQYCSYYEHIYTRGVYLDFDGQSELLGVV